MQLHGLFPEDLVVRKNGALQWDLDNWALPVLPGFLELTNVSPVLRAYHQTHRNLSFQVFSLHNIEVNSLHGDLCCCSASIFVFIFLPVVFSPQFTHLGQRERTEEDVVPTHPAHGPSLRTHLGHYYGALRGTLLSLRSYLHDTFPIRGHER